MSQPKKKRLLIILACIIVFIAGVVLLCVVPFRHEVADDGAKVTSPIIPCYEIKEYEYVLERPSNEPFIGTWDWPECTREKVVLIFGKEYSRERYLVYSDGRVKYLEKSGTQPLVAEVPS